MRGILCWGHPASAVRVAREARDVIIVRPERIMRHIIGAGSDVPLTWAQIASMVAAVSP